jgi:hypothetical protein
MVRIRNDLSCYGRVGLVLSLLLEIQPCPVKQAHEAQNGLCNILIIYSYYKSGYSVIGKCLSKFRETIIRKKNRETIHWSKDFKHLAENNSVLQSCS